MALLRTGCCRSSFASVTLIGTRTAQRKSENEGKRPRMVSSTPTTSRDRYGRCQCHDGFLGGETYSTITGRSGPRQSGSCFSFFGQAGKPDLRASSPIILLDIQPSLLCVFASLREALSARDPSRQDAKGGLAETQRTPRGMIGLGGSEKLLVLSNTTADENYAGRLCIPPKKPSPRSLRLCERPFLSVSARDLARKKIPIDPVPWPESQ